MFTKRDHVKILAKNVMSRLEQDEAIVLKPQMRQNVYQDLYSKIAPVILTDEDVREKVIAQLGVTSEALDESSTTESDQYKTAKKMILQKIGENAVEGLYYQKPIRDLAKSIGEFVMNHESVEEVFLPDEDLEKSVVDFIKRFKPDQLH